MEEPLLVDCRSLCHLEWFRDLSSNLAETVAGVLSSTAYWRVTGAFSRDTAGCTAEPTDCKFFVNHWLYAKFMRSMNSLIVMQGSEACCPGTPMAAAGWFPTGTQEVCGWVVVSTNWKYMPCLSVYVAPDCGTGRQHHWTVPLLLVRLNIRGPSLSLVAHPGMGLLIRG